VLEAVFVLPLVLVHSQDEGLIVNFLLLFNVGQSLHLLQVEEVIVAVGHPLVVLEQPTAREPLHARRVGLSEVDVCFLLVPGVLQDLVRC